MTVTTASKMSEILSQKNSTESSEKPEKKSDVVIKPEGYPTIFGTFQTPLLWFNIFGMSTLHVLAIYMLFNYQHANYPGRLALWTYITSYFLVFGVTGGAHRLWTHRGYKATTPLRICLMLLFSSSMQNSLYDWARNHRMHHKYADTDADPHNSRRGFFFCHVGWLLMRKHPDIKSKGKSLDMSDVLADPVIQFHQKYYAFLAIFAGIVVPTVIPMLWGEELFYSFMTFFVRLAITLNFTWFVNSVAHMWGTRPYDKEICPVEAHSLVYFGNGEYWHNYHHTFPWDYKAAELGDWTTNSTAFWINQFAKIGWAYDLKTASQDLIRKTSMKVGDGTHSQWGAVEMPINSQRSNKSG